jgi:hypothetical protein
VYVPVIQAALQRGGSGTPTQPQGWQPPTVTPQIAAPQQQPQPAQAQQEGQPEMSQLTPEERKAVDEMNAKMQACWAKHQQLITQVAPFVMDRFKAGETGFDLRDWFLHRHGRLIWANFRDDSGPEVLTALTGLHPVLKTIMTPPDAVLLYFQEFFTEPGQEPEGTVVPEVEETDNAA